MSSFQNTLKKLVNSKYGDDEDYDLDDVIIHNSDIVLKANKMQYLLFDFEKEIAPGKYERVFKAIKMIKLVRIPKKDLTLTNFLNMQSGVITGWNMAQINMLQIIANITKPYKKGLIFAYGVQGVSNSSIQEAKESADEQMAALEKGLTGTFRTMEYDDLDAEDARWILKKMNEMKHLLVVRGIPEPKISKGRANTTIFTSSDQKDAEEQSEEFLLGMDEYEYLLVLSATTVAHDTLSKWTEAALKEQTYWASLKNGTKSMTFGLSVPMVYGANIGASEGWNSGHSQTFGENYSTSHTVSHGTNESWSSSESWGEGTSQSFSQGESYGNNQGLSANNSFGESLGRGTSLSTGTSESNSIGHSTTQSEGSSFGESSSTSQTVSDGTSTSESHSTGTSNSLSQSQSFGESISQSEGWGQNHGTSLGTNVSTGTSGSTGSSTSWSEGESSGTSSSSSHGTNSGWSSSNSNSHSDSQSSSNSASVSGSISNGVSIGGAFSPIGTNSSVTIGGSLGTTTGAGQSDTSGSSNGNSGGTSSSTSTGTSHSTSSSVGGGTSTSQGWSNSVGSSQGISEGISHSTSIGSGASWSNGVSSSTGTSTSDSVGTGTSHSVSNGLSQGISSSQNSSLSQGVSLSSGKGSSTSMGTSDSYGQSASASLGSSLGTSQGWSQSQSYGTSTSHSVSNGHSVGVSESVSDGVSQGVSTSRGISSGLSGGTSRGVSGSLGLGPSLSFGKTFQWEDREATRLVDMLQFSLQRLIEANNNLGMWFTDVYIMTESREASMAASTLAMSAWHSPNTMICPLQVYEPSPLEKEYLNKHLSVFSPSVKKEGIPGQFESYKYSTLLLSDELSAMTHPPRVNVGGILTSVDDPMVLPIPGNRQNGEIFLGYVADVEKFSKTHKYKSGFKYCINANEIHHAYFSGASRSGKTVAAKRMVAETYNNVRRGESKKKLRFVIMDPKMDWRALSKVIPPEHFRFYSLADPQFHPIKMNLMKIPKGVYAERYVNTLREIFVRSYGLGDRGYNILGQAIIDIYTDAGVFEDDTKLNQKDPFTGLYPATEKSKNVTLTDVAARLREIQDGCRGEKQDAIQRILDRLYDFEADASIAKDIFCNRGDGMGIDDLLGEDDVIVLESFGMNMMTSSFIFGLLTSSIYQYAVANGGFNTPDQYETILVLEEANQVLIGEDRDNLGGPNPFEIILDQSAGFGLFIWSITQKIADMPQSILANCAIKVIGRQDRPDDIELSVVQIGKEGKITDRQWKEWFPDMPQGWFIVKSTRNRDFKMNAPCHVLVEYLDAEPPTNTELDQILSLNQLRTMSA